MAVSLENLIDLNLLTHYDTNMKAWVSKQISSIIATDTSLPETGEEGILYIVGTSLYLWDGEKYQEISAGEKDWTDF